MNPLPIRIMYMIKALHKRGYSSVYLYSGLSPSGMSWRYEIGQLVNDQWPVKPAWVKGSVLSEGKTPWTDDNSTLLSLTDGFQQYFQHQLCQNHKPSPYSLWYTDVLKHLKADELLVFFADYGGPHQHLLASAPGFIKS